MIMTQKMMNWDEKYKPSKISDIVGQRTISKRLQAYASAKRMPHLLFAGPAGVGKTSSFYALAKEIFGSGWKANTHIFNASKDRSINFIRTDINDLTRIMPVGAPFQLIFLDEADLLTPDAQGALREIMQSHTDTCKFVLSCNYPNKIIAPIQDRCRVFRFSRVAPTDIQNRLLTIAEAEHIKFDKDALMLIAERSEGSVRSAVTHLQTLSEYSKELTTDIVNEELPTVSFSDIDILVNAALKGDTKTYEQTLYDIYYKGGFSSNEVLAGILDCITSILDQSSDQYKNVVWLIGEYDWRITQGSNDLLQLRCLLRQLEGSI